MAVKILKRPSSQRARGESLGLFSDPRKVGHVRPRSADHGEVDERTICTFALVIGNAWPTFHLDGRPLYVRSSTAPDLRSGDARATSAGR